MTFAKTAFEQIERELRKKNFGILGTVSTDGRSHSTGVMYAVSSQDEPLKIYVVTRTRNKKVRNIAKNPNVSFVVPLSRRLLSFVPPSCIQFQGTARIVDATDKAAIRAFESSYVLRMILRLESDIVTQHDDQACFIKISPDPTVFTYGLGISPLELGRRAAHAAAKVQIPSELLEE